jgi:PEP-CTERM motif
MRHMGLAWVAIVGAAVIGTPLAEAGMTCKVIPSWCPATDKNAPPGNSGSGSGPTKTAVPEPATLMLLGVGASAVGLAMRRRRKP